MSEIVDKIIDAAAALPEFSRQELVENPLTHYPDLDPCLCGSGHIWRRCHKQSLIAMIPKDEAEKVQAFLDRRAKAKT